MPFCPLLGEGSPTKVDYRKQKGTVILSSLLEDLAGEAFLQNVQCEIKVNLSWAVFSACLRQPLPLQGSADSIVPGKAACAMGLCLLC